MNRAELERKWRARVEAARQRYVESKSASDRAAVEWGGDLVPAPGGDEMVRQAVQSEYCAFEEYDRTLRIYTDLVLDGKVPEEPDS